MKKQVVTGESKKTVNTGELMKILGKSNTKYSDFLEIGENAFVEDNLVKFWAEMGKKCPLQNSDIINRADIGYTFFYDIINGKKKPSREKLVRIFLAMGLSLGECSTALRIYCYSDFYAKNKRDSAFIYAVNHSLSVNELNELLRKNGEEELK